MLAWLLPFLLWGGIKIEKTDEQWRSELGRERYCVMRKKATEPAFSGKYVRWTKEGVFTCAACTLSLFHSSKKIETSHGWPAFEEPVVQRHVWIKEDRSLTFLRYEVLCRGCDSHIGHVFRKGDSFRYVVNSISLEFKQEL